MRALMVTDAFGSYQPGEAITDRDAMEAALESNPGYVVAVDMPDAPEKPGKSKGSTDQGAEAPSPSPSPTS